MSQINNILPRSNVFFDLDVGSKKRVFEQVGLLLENSEKLSRSTVFDSLFARERLGSTGLGHGVAIPHGRIKGLREAVGVLIRLKQPILFDAPDGKPVSLLFVLLVPDQATDLHLQLLSELAQLFSSKVLREKLLSAPDADTLFRLVTEWGQNAAG